MPTEAIRAFAVPHWARLGAIALCYFAAAKASLIFAIPPGYATAIWPPSGIALAALLLWGMRAWPGVWLGAALTNYTVDLSMPAALGIATGNTLEGVCAAWLVSRLTDRNAEFVQPEKVFLFAAIAALASMVAATVGVSSLYFAGSVSGEQFFGNWYTWWQGDATGILLVTPCILAWARGASDAGTRAGTREIAIFGTLLVATLVAVFAHGAEGYDAAPLAFLVLPFFVWAACRFSERIVTLTILGANSWAIWCTVNGLGPFQGFPLNEALLMLQAFTSTGTLVALVLWALLRRRAEALRLLQLSHDDLAKSMWSRTHELREQVQALEEAQALAHVGSWYWDRRSNRVVWSEELCRICGITPDQFDGSFDRYFEWVHPADRERVRATIKNAYAKHSSWDSVERIIRGDGEPRILRSIGRASPGRGGAAVRLRGVFIDVTERGAMAAIAPPEHGTTALEELGLPEALRACGAQFELRTGISAEVLGNGAASNLDARAALALFRIAEEALNNVSRHARARRVMVELEYEAGLATLTVRDDGCGFDPAWQAKGGSGLKHMRERAVAVGGKLWIESTPGNGSTLRVTARG
jgi:PAS domain S-box-containing protein